MRYYIIKTKSDRLHNMTKSDLELLSGIYYYDEETNKKIHNILFKRNLSIEEVAIYSEFNTLEEAELNFDLVELDMNTLKHIYYEPSNKITIYVDGSFRGKKAIQATKNVKSVIGVGAVLLRPNKIPIYLIQTIIPTNKLLPSTSNCAELITTIKALKFCRLLGIKSIDLKYDYNMVESLTNPFIFNSSRNKVAESLNTKKQLSEEELTKRQQVYSLYNYYYQNYIDLTKSIDINFIKVKSHSGIYFQEWADKLAKLGSK